MALPPPPTTPTRLPRATKVHFGLGFVGCNLMVIGLENLIFPVFSLYLGLSPALIGLALIVPRIWDGMVDLFIGRFSDNLRSRWGRRRPLIVGGALATGITFGLIWMVPEGLSETGMTVWLIATLMLFWTTQGIFYVPLEALGMTLTSDYHERTTLMAYRSLFAKMGQLASAWCFWLVESGYFGTDHAGAINVGWLWAGLIVIFGVWPGLMLRDPNPLAPAVATVPVNLWQSLKSIVRRPVFRRLSGYLIFASGSMSISSGIHFYTNLHYVAGGDAELASRLFGVGTTLNIISGIIVLPVVGWSSRRIGKHCTAQWAVSATGVGSLLSWWLFTPAHPWLSLGITPFIGMGIVAVYQLYFALLADAAEQAALESGRPSEGLFSATTNCLAKLGQATALATGGALLGWIGIEGRDFTPSPTQMEGLRIMRALLPTALSVGAIFCLRNYPLTQENLEVLRQKHGAPTP